jgi:hypothetical protein
MKQFITLVTFLMLLLFNNCKHEPKPVIRSSNNDTSLKDLVCFNTQILPLITASCAQVGCHDAITQEEGLILNSYDGIINMGTEDLVKYITLTSGKMMPPLPQPRMDITNINLIKKWIAEGAKNSNCIPINCDTSNVLYSNEIAPIINTYCKGCHNTGNKGGNVNLDNLCNFYNLPIGKATSRSPLYRIKTYSKPIYYEQFSNEIFKIKLFVCILILVFTMYKHHSVH